MASPGRVFSTGDTAGTGQVESLRQDLSQGNIKLTELMLNNLAEDGGQYVGQSAGVRD